MAGAGQDADPEAAEAVRGVVTERWVWVSMKHATFAVAVRDGKVVSAPPIAWKMIRRLGSDDWRVFAADCQKRKAVFAELPETGAG